MIQQKEIQLETKFWYLKDHQLLNYLGYSQIKMICFISNFKTAKKGEIIYFSTPDADRVYLIKRGTIKIVEENEDGKEVIKELLQNGDLFGGFEINTEENPYEQAIVLSEKAILCSFLRQDFERMLQDYPQVALKYTKWMGLRFRRLQNRYANLMFKDVRTRFVLFLEDWAEREGEKLDNEIIIKNILTHQDVASLICCTRQTVSQLFAEFRDQGRIEYSRSFVKIKNIFNV